MRPEQALYNLVKDHLPGHHQRIESIAGVGAPDIELCYEGKSCWIELKVSPVWKIVWDLLRPSQQVWHIKRVKQTGLVFLVTRVNNRICLLKATYVKENIVQYTCIWDREKPWDWADFFAKLTGELK